MRKNEKGMITTIFLVVAGLSLLLVAGYFLLKQSRSTTQTPISALPVIQDSNDFNKAANDFDSTNTTELDTNLKQLDSDASGL